MTERPESTGSRTPATEAHGPETDAPAEREVVFRRAPSVVAFMITGLVIGLVLAVFSVLFGPTDQTYTPGGVYGVVAVIFGTAGLVIGALVGLLLDRISRRRARRFTAVPLTEDEAAQYEQDEDAPSRSEDSARRG